MADAAVLEPAAPPVEPLAPVSPAPAAVNPSAPAPVAPAPGPAAGPSPGATPPVEPAPVPFDVAKLSLPADAQVPDYVLAGIADEAKTLGLTLAQGQTLLESRVAHEAATVAALYAEVEADAELGGTHLEQTKELAARGRDFLWPPGSPDAATMGAMFRGALGNTKAFVRAMVAVGKARTEDRPGTTGTGVRESGTAVRTEDLLYPTSVPKS